MGDDNPFDTIRLNHAQREALLNRLERDAIEVSSRACKRRHERYAYRVDGLDAHFIHPGGAESRCVVAARNLSASGVGLLHGGFVYGGTRCHVTLIDARDNERRVSGVVRACRLVSGSVHEVGVEFDELINLEEYFAACDNGCDDDADDAPPAAQGTVLIVDPDRASARLLEHHLASASIGCTVAASNQIASELLRTSAVNVVFVSDAALTGDASAPLVLPKGWRSRGAVIATTADGHPAHLRKLRSAGFDDVLLKPYCPNEMLAMLARQMQRARRGDVIRSTMPGGPGVDRLLSEFVTEARAAVTAMREALDAGDNDALRTAALALKGSGAGYGYDAASDAAGDLVAAIDRGGSRHSLRKRLAAMSEVVLRLRPERVEPAPDGRSAA